MELVTRVVALAVLVAAWLAMMRGRVPEMAVALVLAFMGVSLAAALGPMAEVVTLLRRLADLVGGPSVHLPTVLRSVAIAYVAGFGAQLCRDAGQEGVAAAVELVGKVAILVTALPVFVALLDGLWRLVPAG